MKKFIAVTVVALMMFAFAASAFALLPTSTAGYKNPPVFVDGLVVSDAWMSGLTMQNWKSSLTNQAYAEGSYIWFIAKVGVAAEGDTDAAHLWDSRSGQTAALTITGKDNCLDFTSANMATLARISGMSIDAQAITNNALSIVEATSKKVVYTFTNVAPTTIDTNGVLGFPANLSILQLDSIHGKNANTTTLRPALGDQRATLQKDFYLHFMAITKAATEGVCMASMKVNGEDTFKRDNNVAVGITGTGPNASYTTYAWYASNTTSESDTAFYVGDRSAPYLLYNTVNGKQYSIFKIKNGNDSLTRTANGVVVGTDPAVSGNYGPYGGKGNIYVLANKELDTVVCGFVVDGGSYLGLVAWNKDDRRAAFSLSGTQVADTCTLPWNYEPIMSNDMSNSNVQVTYATGGGAAVSKAELQAIFDFFGFGYENSRAPGDADFLARTGLVTTAEAKYNVANAVIATPDQNIVVPKTGDAATSTGLILVASAILAAAAVGFVLSKRAHN